MARTPTVALLTDFGYEDTYVGVVKSVILSRRPDCRFIDLSHAVAPQSVREAAYLAWTAHRYLPSGTVLLCVVDPGVGTERRAMAATWPRGAFVGPDNGWLSFILQEAGATPTDGRARLPEGWRAVELTNSDLWLTPLSDTFHGRDIFAPVAARLAAGDPLEDAGTPCDELVAFSSSPKRSGDGTVTGEILHVDHFGNLITNITAFDLPESFTVQVAGGSVSGPARSYQSDAPLVALVGSSGLLEVGAPNGSAGRLLRASVGDPISVTPKVPASVSS
ncbi:MAG TPA: SAM-dependent chlorinase/fluorinase [Chloroflexota bacterium]|nr:SAM-dependent chlorinase/fluorinase [Chloroflexota bacterium]